ncbi:MAG: hypothetical protein HY718_02250 [Planctomycetes bacterium]|nr:hypothetical protein [Planctomycetota bacterium]
MLDGKWSSWAVGGGVACLVGLALVVSIRTLGSEPQVIRLTRPVACSSCGYASTHELTDRPAQCPNCGKRSLWPALRCTACGQNVPVDTFRLERESRDPYCFKCGSAALVPINDGHENASARGP